MKIKNKWKIKEKKIKVKIKYIKILENVKAL